MIFTIFQCKYHNSRVYLAKPRTNHLNISRGFCICLVALCQTMKPTYKQPLKLCISAPGSRHIRMVVIRRRIKRNIYSCTDNRIWVHSPCLFIDGRFGKSQRRVKHSTPLSFVKKSGNLRSTCYEWLTL